MVTVWSFRTVTCNLHVFEFMEGLNIGFISGEVIKVDNYGNNKRELYLRHVELVWKAKKPQAFYDNSVAWTFGGLTVPCGTYVCIPCAITGGDELERATVFATAITIAKSDKKNMLQTGNFAWITGEVVAYEPTRNPHYINIILKSNKRFIKANIQTEANKTNIGDYILANCTIGSSGDFSYFKNCKIHLFIKNFINLPKDTILYATDKMKEAFQQKITTGEVISVI